MRPTIDLPLEQRMELYTKAMQMRKETGWGYWRVARELGISADTVGNWFYHGKMPSRLNLSPSPELSYIIGVCRGDGYLRIGTNGKRPVYSVGLGAKDQDFVVEFSKCLAKVLGRSETKIQFHEGLFVVRATSRAFYDFIKGEDKEEHKKRYPAEYLRGLFDSDGCVQYYFNKNEELWNGWVELWNTNHQLLVDTKNLLSEHFSVYSTLRLHKKAGSVRLRPHSKHKRFRIIRQLKDLYVLGIYRRADIKRFRDSIGFKIKRKQEKLGGLLGHLGTELRT